MAPFSMTEARRALEDALHGKLEDHFVSFGRPVAAASIAQVHKAEIEDPVRAAHEKMLPSRFCGPTSSGAFVPTSIVITSPPSKSSAFILLHVA